LFTKNQLFCVQIFGRSTFVPRRINNLGEVVERVIRVLGVNGQA
jgi:hypothetical protein